MKHVNYIALAATILLSGCELLYKDEVRVFAEDLVKECDGQIDSVAIVKSSKGGNIYDALAVAIIDGEKYNVNMEVKTGLDKGIISSEDNPCLEHGIKTGVKEFFDLFK